METFLSGAAFCLYDWAFWMEVSGVYLAELSQLKWLLEPHLSLRGSDPISTCCSHSGVTSGLNSHYDSNASPRLSLVIPLQLICLFVGWINTAPWGNAALAAFKNDDMYWVLTLYYLPSSWSFISQQDHSSNSFRNWFCGSHGWSFSFQTYFMFHLSEWHLNWLSDRWYKASLQFPPWQSHTLWYWRLPGGEKLFPNVLAVPSCYLQSGWVQRGIDFLKFCSTTPVA